METNEETIPKEPVVMRPVRKEAHTVCIELSAEEMRLLKEAADSQCRSVSNQAKWILRSSLI